MYFSSCDPSRTPVEENYCPHPEGEETDAYEVYLANVPSKRQNSDSFPDLPDSKPHALHPQDLLITTSYLSPGQSPSKQHLKTKFVDFSSFVNHSSTTVPHRTDAH